MNEELSKKRGIRITKIKLFSGLWLVGAPGIGKTEIVKDLAEEEAKKLGRIFVDLREADDKTINDILEKPSKYYVFIRVIAPHVFPEDIGVPDKRPRFVEYLPPKVLAILSLPEIYGVLFIDEINNVQRDDQISMYYSIIQEKEAGFQLKFSENIKIILAGNTPEWSEISRPLPKPMRGGRVIKFEVTPPTIDEWIEYMNKKYDDKWERLIGAYLKAFPEDFIKPPSDDWSAFPTPRSWTKLATLLYQFRDEDEEFRDELIRGTVGDDVGVKVITLLNTRIDIEEMIRELSKDPSVWQRLDINAKIMLLYSLSQRQIKELKERLENFIRYLMMNDREMLVLMVVMMNKEKRLEFATAFKEIVRELIKDIGKYIMPRD